MTRSRDWVDYLDRRDAEAARADASYRAAIERTPVGRMAHVQAESAPILGVLDDLAAKLVAWLARSGGPFRVW